MLIAVLDRMMPLREWRSPLQVACAAAMALVGCGRSRSATSEPSDAGGSPDGGAAEVSSACGAHDPFGPQLYPTSLPPAYEGPAQVERSTVKDLELIFHPLGSALPTHPPLVGLQPMPQLPLGASVWLSVAAGARPPDFGPAPQWSIVVRDKQGGRVLLGAAFNPSDTIPSPVPLGVVAPACSGPNPDTCARGTTITYATVDIVGDRTVTIADGATATVSIGGIDYVVRVSAQTVAVPASTQLCPDYFPPGGLAVDVQAKDLASLGGALTVDALPACVEGNVVVESANFAITGVDFRTGYEGPAVYSHKVDNYLLFSVMGLTSLTGDSPMLQIYAPGLIEEPSVGDEFWASLTSASGAAPTVAVLRKAQSGPLLLAWASGPAPFDAAFTAAIAQRLGVQVDTQERCAYAAAAPSGTSGVVSLWDTFFQTSPPVRVASETTAIVSIAGADFNVWATGEGSYVSFTLQAR